MYEIGSKKLLEAKLILDSNIQIRKKHTYFLTKYSFTYLDLM